AIEDEQRPRVVAALGNVHVLEQRGMRGRARPLVVSIFDLTAIGLSERVEERAELRAQIVGEAARGEVEVRARLLPLRFAYAIDPAVLQRREHAERDHEQQE